MGNSTEALKLALEALTYIYTETTADEDELIDKAITAIKEALAQTQAPVAKVIDWGVEGPRLQGLTNDWPVVGTLLYTSPPQRTEQNFCSRCGKRLGGIDSIHTCTPPVENNT